MRHEEPVFVLRTTGEALCAMLLVMQASACITALLRSVGAMTAVISTVPWHIDLGVEILGLGIFMAIYLFVCRRNDDRTSLGTVNQI